MAIQNFASKMATAFNAYNSRSSIYGLGGEMYEGRFKIAPAQGSRLAGRSSYKLVNSQIQFMRDEPLVQPKCVGDPVWVVIDVDTFAVAAICPTEEIARNVVRLIH